MEIATLPEFAALTTPELELRLATYRERRVAGEEALADELATYEIELELQRRALASAREQLETSHARYERLYDFAPIGYVTLDRAGMIRQANVACAALFGIDREQLAGWPMLTFVDEKSRRALLDHLNRCSQYGRAVTEVVLRAGVGPQRTVQLYATVVGDAHDAETLTAITDVTDRKAAENALVAARDELDRRVRLRTTELQRANEKLMVSAERAEQLEIELRLRMDDMTRADRNKDEFLAMLAHELRNPLAPIQAAAEVLRVAGGDPTRVEWARMVIGRQIAHLRRLVDDLLDLSRITLGKFGITAEPIELRPVVDRAIELVGQLVETRHHRLVVAHPSEGLSVRGDRERLAQAIANLLHNAAKYTPEGGEIGVQVHADGDDAVVRVTDTGEGMTPDLLRRIFDPFEQGDRSLARAGGLGIGLTLVKRIVELHGGTISASSEGRGRGSTFDVRLPVSTRAAAEAAAMPARPVAAPASAPVRKVLVVDDNPDALDSLATLLRLEGHDIRTAQDAEAAVAQAIAFRPDIALLDIGLPGIDGYELAGRLRALPETRDAMLVALTGYGRREDFTRSDTAGFNHHLVKPVDPARLSALIAGERGSRSGDVPPP